ncbi:MAG TPA: DUF86 domain-containing protein [Candidatus Hydrogenedentes bacterium]|nr:DUF86 domain-containing protein [Candidatus Hydrogenedentota bacterium]
MLPDPVDASRLWDMLDAARCAVAFTKGRSFAEFVSDRMMRNAVERNLEIIGEAARNVSAGFRESRPDIPWRSIVGLRNVIAHEYGEVRLEIIWSVIQDKLAPLIGVLEAMDLDGRPQA